MDLLENRHNDIAGNIVTDHSDIIIPAPPSSWLTYTKDTDTCQFFRNHGQDIVEDTDYITVLDQDTTGIEEIRLSDGFSLTDTDINTNPSRSQPYIRG